MEEELKKTLKYYVSILINEYKDYLDKDALFALKNIDYQKIVISNDINIPFGTILYNQIYLSSLNEELINNLKKMPNYNIMRRPISCYNLSSYLKYMCENGYEIKNFYEEILMYFLFSLIIKNSSFLIKGFINQEMKLLSIKYGIKIGSLYNREERLVEKIAPIFKLPLCRKLMFMNSVDAFKFLNDQYGYRYAKLFYDVCFLTDREYQKIRNKNITSINDLLDYVSNYDKLSYVDAYDCILDFKVINNMI